MADHLQPGTQRLVTIERHEPGEDGQDYAMIRYPGSATGFAVPVDCLLPLPFSPTPSNVVNGDLAKRLHDAANHIDERLGPISGATADRLAVLLREAAALIIAEIECIDRAATKSLENEL